MSDEDRPNAGVIETLAPGLRRLLAPNPSPMTYWGTNTFVLGEGAVTVIDPGPALPAHLDALLAGLAPGERVAHILVTHAHLDHSPLARPLAEATGAPVMAFGPADAGRTPLMEQLAAQGLAGGGEGVDIAFRPDVRLADGDRFNVGGTPLEVVATPGHMAGHLAFAWNGALFSGDHVMGWASTLISPPDGDLTAFLAACARLRTRPERLYHPAHGAPICDPVARLDWLIAHRQEREAQILAALAGGSATIPQLAATIYADTPPALRPAAERNIFAHLIDLVGRGRARAAPGLTPTARFRSA